MSTFPDSQLIRAAADGELTDEQRAALEARRAEVPEIDQRIAFERSLREAVGRAMAGPNAPAELRSRIEQTLGPASVGVVRTGLGNTTARSFWARTPRWLAVAAVVALSATILIVALARQGAPAGFDAVLAQAAGFIAEEHERCGAFSQAFEQKFTARDEAESLSLAIQLLDRVPDIAEFPVAGLDIEGYTFAGLGACAVPGTGKSVHLVYRDSADASRLQISLFIQVDTGELEIDDETCFTGFGGAGEGVAIWRQDGFVYYLYAADDRAEDAARDAFEAPQRTVEMLAA